MLCFVPSSCVGWPGRLKASRIALGDHYSRLTSTQFDWTELRFRTTAKIPLIDLNKILEEPDPDKQAHKHQRTCHWSMLLPWMKQREWKPEASWYRLLGNTLTERADFKRLNCQTDYLPDDIQAAPAQAYFDSLIILAMLAGCNKLQPSEGYLLATGGGRQLDFRQHQSLGVVAVYQEYDVLGKALDRRSDDFPHLQRTILEGLGSVFHNGESFSTAVLNPSRQLVLKLDPTKLPKLDLIPKDACTHDKCARKNVLASRTYGFSPSPFSEYFNLIQYDPKVTQINALLTLLFAQKPTSAILFPTSAVNFRQPLRMICREANTNSFKFAVNLFKHLPQDHTPMESPEVDSAKPDVLVPDDLEDRSNWSQAILDNYGKAQSTDNGNRKVDEYSPKGFRLSRPALGACFDWINDAEYFDKLESESADSIRRCLHFQLRVVDWWLCSRGKVDALCSALKLIEIVRTATILQPEDDKDAIQQPYLKVSRDHIDLQTLNHFGLPWEYDSDPSYLLIMKVMNEKDVDVLFEHTRRIRTNQRDNQRPYPPPNDRADADAGPGDEEDVEEEGEDNEEGGDKDERIVEGEDEKVEEKADANADADADADADTGAEINADAKAGTGADAAAPAKVVRVKPQLLSLEILDTLVLYRAMLVAALLASGADTSELLLYKNRKQVVQVL